MGGSARAAAARLADVGCRVADEMGASWPSEGMHERPGPRCRRRALTLHGGGRWRLSWGKVRDGPISRVLSRTTIYLLRTSPPASSAQPERGAGHTMALLFAFAPDGACQAVVLPRRWWSLTPPFQLFPLRGPKGPDASWSLLFCGAFRRVTPPGRWPASCPVEPGLSSWLAALPREPRGRLAHLAGEIVARPCQVSCGTRGTGHVGRRSEGAGGACRKPYGRSEGGGAGEACRKPYGRSGGARAGSAANRV